MYLFIQEAWILSKMNNFKTILLIKLFYLRAVAFLVDPSEALY